MLLKGKHALERAGQILKELSTSQKSGAAKRSAMALPEDDAALLISFLERLGWTFKREARSPQENLCAWLTHSTGRDATNEELAAIWQEYEAYAHGLTIPDEHCIGIATRLLQIRKKIPSYHSYRHFEHTDPEYVSSAKSRLFDAKLIRDQLEMSSVSLSFLVPPSDFLSACQLSSSGELVLPADRDVISSHRCWLDDVRSKVICAAIVNGELPDGWECATEDEVDAEDDLPLAPLKSQNELRRWLISKYSQINGVGFGNCVESARLLAAKRVLRNTERTLEMLAITSPEWFLRRPGDFVQATELIERMSRTLRTPQDALKPEVADEKNGVRGIIKLKRGDAPPANAFSVLEFCEELAKLQSDAKLTAKNLKKKLESCWGKNHSKGADKSHLKPTVVAAQASPRGCEYFHIDALIQIRNANQIGDLAREQDLREKLRMLRTSEPGGYPQTSQS